MRDNSDNDQTPWIAHGNCTAEHEDFLIGNKAGLTLLRDMTDRALSEGECAIGQTRIEFIGIRVVENDPRQKPITNKRGRKDIAALWGCGLIAFLLLFIFIVGLSQISHWFK